MRALPRVLVRIRIVFLVLLSLAGFHATVRAQIGTAFTYQGQLQNGGTPQSGPCDFRFKLYDAATNGNQIGSTQTLSNTSVANGLFTVSIDFGSSAFTGAPRWLETAVACPSGGSLTTLSPRQSLKPAPSAIVASTVVAPLSLSGGGSATVGATNTGGGSGVYGQTQGATGFAGAAGVWGDSNAFFGVWGTSNTNAGVWGESAGADGVHGHTGSGSASGVAGFNSANGNGVYGNSSSGTGVWGESGGFDGVHGHTTAGSAAGIAGLNDSSGAGAFGSSASGDGVYGNGATGVHGNSTFGWGVYGHSQAADGVHGDTPNNNNSGVAGINTGNGFGVYGSTNNGIGVAGFAAQGDGVFGSASGDGQGGGTGNGVHGAGTAQCFDEFCSAGTDAVMADGVLNVSNAAEIHTDLWVFGDKHFAAPDPTDPSRQITYSALEGPEAGTFFRGTSHLVGGYAEVEVPESFRLISADRGLTAIATPVGSPAIIVCMSKSLDKIVFQGSADVDFDYMVNGIRKGYETYKDLRNNFLFVPRRSSDAWLAKLPPEAVRRLKANKILNDDGTVNAETAHRLGWDQRPGWNEPERMLPSQK